MAFHVRIALAHETPISADYEYDGGLQGRGVARLKKGTGEVRALEGDGGEAERVFRCAAMTIARAWRNGSLPERMEYAA